MYEIDGEFGKVRLANYVFSQQAMNLLACFSGVGWHHCNDLYHIARPNGCGDALILFTVSGNGALNVEDRMFCLVPGSIALIPQAVRHEYYTPKDGIWEFYWAHPQGTISNAILEYFFHLCDDTSIALIPQAVRHEYYTPKDGIWEFYWAHPQGTISNAILEYFFHLCDDTVFHSENIGMYIEKIETIMQYIKNKESLSEMTLCAEFSDLMYKLLSDTRDHTVPKRISGSVIRYMEKHYAENISIKKLSEEFYVSPSHLIRCFKKESGYTPYEYLGMIRLTKACGLLEYTDMSVEQVAEAVGMPHVGRFITKFKKLKGVTPGNYRKQYVGLL